MSRLVSGALLAILPLLAQEAPTPKTGPKTGTIGLYRNQLLAPDAPARNIRIPLC